ncbi:unnamed protein product [Rotaria sordida]|uniref:Uncharacterized protein n=1 Tax=Rotaria sordida TaxID=392033 RepID=A0A819EH04_9BILA|nr:unnamed protein product [Rotaria sordida]CAF3849434.1 unnamed protein product [Rotaria sordida]
MNLIGEVISSTETTRGYAETGLRQTQIELNASRIMQIELTKVGETIRSHYTEARDAVQKAQSEYSRALSRIPTGFKALLLDLGRAVIGLVKAGANAVIEVGKNLVKAAIPIAVGVATGGISTAMGALGGLMSTGTGSVATGQALTFGKLFSNSLNQVAPRVKEILRTGANDNSESKNPLEELEAYKVTFETFLSSMQSGKESPLKQQAGGLIKRGVDLFEEVSNQVKNAVRSGEKIDPQVAKDFENRVNELVQEAKPMAAAESMSGAEVPAAPASERGSGDSSQNEKFAAQLAITRLRDAETRYDKIFEHLKQNQEDLAKLMGKIATLDMTQVNYKQLIELLREALRLLARVREQWGQLVLFFAEVATKAEIILTGTLNPFITQASEAGSEDFSLDERLFYVDILKAQADDIEAQSEKYIHAAQQSTTQFQQQSIPSSFNVQQASDQNVNQRKRTSFDQLKHVVSSNLPCFHVQWVSDADRNDIPSAIHASNLIFKELQTNGVKINPFTLVGWASKKLKLGVNNKDDYATLDATDK